VVSPLLKLKPRPVRGARLQSAVLGEPEVKRERLLVALALANLDQLLGQGLGLSTALGALGDTSSSPSCILRLHGSLPCSLLCDALQLRPCLSCLTHLTMYPFDFLLTLAPDSL